MCSNIVYANDWKYQRKPFIFITKAFDEARAFISVPTYTLPTSYLHPTYTLSTPYLHPAYTLPTHHSHPTYTQPTPCLHPTYLHPAGVPCS